MPYKKNAPTKEAQKPTFTVEEEIPIGNLLLSDTQAISVSLVRNKGNRYVSIKRMYKTKNNDSYKPKSGIWIPFEETNNIISLLMYSYDEGIKAHWDEPAITPEEISIKSDGLPPIEENDIHKSMQIALQETKSALDKLNYCIEHSDSLREKHQDTSSLELIKEQTLRTISRIFGK
ncbi:hypothetical protein [Anaerosinus massiliensis]|uniref:hypothetical protein n=1 Tax=Massilibacillus massiliensis TaxID=1806837 RepID=UPI000DA63DD1|nr:hypothetical protein [Massilibacillus massiliensis]